MELLASLDPVRDFNGPACSLQCDFVRGRVLLGGVDGLYDAPLVPAPEAPTVIVAEVRPPTDSRCRSRDAATG